MGDIKLLTVPEVSEILSITPRTVRNYCYSGKIEYLKIGKDIRISEQALKNFLENVKVNGGNNNE